MKKTVSFKNKLLLPHQGQNNFQDGRYYQSLHLRDVNELCTRVLLWFNLHSFSLQLNGGLGIWQPIHFSFYSTFQQCCVLQGWGGKKEKSGCMQRLEGSGGKMVQSRAADGSSPSFQDPGRPCQIGTGAGESRKWAVGPSGSRRPLTSWRGENGKTWQQKKERTCIM